MTPPQENTTCICGDLKCQIPYGYCHCGCGEKTRISPSTAVCYGWKRGLPLKFCLGHWAKIKRIIEGDYLVIDGEQCRTIILSSGQAAIVDAADYEWLNQWKWSATWNKPTRSYYGFRRVYLAGEKPHNIKMHRLILGLLTRDGRRADHKNLNTLDNRRSNIRVATVEQNAWNRPTMRTNTSGFKGVSLKKQTGRWQAAIRANGKLIYLGYHATPEDAHAAYCEAALRLHGDFANTERRTA